MTEPKRIVSLLASGTELVCALGLGDRLVGRSHECDAPPWVRSLPAVSEPTFDITGTSREIDALVRERLRAGAPLYRVHDDLLLELAPDVLITQTHCEVCAVSPADLVHRVPGTLVRQQVVALSAGNLAAILDGFARVASVLHRDREADALIAGYRARLAAVRQATRSLRVRGVVCLEWIEPTFAMGNWGPELVDIAGGHSLLGSPGEHSTTSPWEAVLAADPEVLVVAPCGFDVERTLAEMHVLAGNPGYGDLRAVREDRVFVADGNRYFNRSGPSAFETPELLAEILHPDVFAPRHQGDGWRRFRAPGAS